MVELGALLLPGKISWVIETQEEVVKVPFQTSKVTLSVTEVTDCNFEEAPYNKTDGLILRFFEADAVIPDFEVN